MNQPVNGRVLLVGEGDFSFTVAMVAQLPEDMPPNITATSLESELTISKHQCAQEHMEYLQGKGVTVLLNTDATQLHLDRRICQQKFARIIFNFPHAGGKSNHKKNRKLLNDFFASAVQVLDEQGHIMVTLCKGQGGTPADKPMRAWQDSWQVVSMAANSNLILVKTIPFHSENYPVYTSTGFRSLDKGFHTENAITHVFEMAEAVEIPPDVYGTVQVNGINYLCSRYLINKFERIRRLQNDHYHPLNRLRTRLQEILHNRYPDLSSNQNTCLFTFKPMKQLFTCDTCNDQSVTTMHSESNRNKNGNIQSVTEKASCSECRLTKYGYMKTAVVSLTLPVINMIKDCERDQDSDLDMSQSGLIFKADAELFDTASVSKLSISSLDKSKEESPLHNLDRVYVRSSLLEHVEHLLENKSVLGDIAVLSSPVFRPCVIEPGVFPLEYHMIYVWTKSHDCHVYMTAVDSDLMAGKLAGSTKFRSHLGCTSMVDAEEVDCLKKMLCALEDRIKYEFISCSEPIYKHGSLHFHNIGAVILQEQGKSEEGTGMKVGDLFHCSQENENQCNFAAVLYVDKLASLFYNIPDPRLLWSAERRVNMQFRDIDHKNLQEVSLYPMSFTHDMSFWENQAHEFDEIEYAALIRNIAGDVVTSVTLIDKYFCTETGKRSRCYRLVFQSSDQALSYDTSWKLQSKIRLLVEEKMGIELR